MLQDGSPSLGVYTVWIKEDLESSNLPYLVRFSSERRQHILQYRRTADRNRTIFAELLARYLICKKSDASKEDVFIERDERGKPFGKVAKGKSTDTWQISLSHSGSWIVCSIGQIMNGVDVETGTDDFEEIAKQFFLPKESAALRKMPLSCRKTAFLCDWTIKESYLKYTGEGLAWGDLSKVDCFALRKGLSDIAGKNFLLPDGAAVGICAERDFLPTHIDFISLNTLKKFWNA